MKQRSTFHFVSGDGRPGRADRAIFRWSARLERLVVRFDRTDLEIRPFEPVFDRAAYVAAFGEEHLNRSPNRVLCFAFLLAHGGEVFSPERAVIDFGCGDGSYAGHIGRTFGYRSYLGLDIAERPNWPGVADARTALRRAHLGQERVDASDYDTIFSHSALEHMAHDVRALRLVESGRRKTISHVHLIPALQSYYEYHYHGYRRYRPKSVANLLTLPGVHNVRVYSFGNGLTRRMARAYYKDDGASFDAEGRARPATMFDRLEREQANLRPQSPADCSFFAVLFDQTLEPTA
ncbi:MAG: class I SAM-dependent methyltransferase [Rhodospirillaceae bacterium]|nr:class I SAM-dependent methyltransferase [Rhodospirillaceae bacterium]